MLTPALGLMLATGAPDPARQALPPPSPPFPRPQGTVLFSDDFQDGNFDNWEPDREGVWSVWRGMLHAELPDVRQEHSFLYAGSGDWQDIAVDVDVCGMRGVDKGVVVRAENNSGIGADLRGPGYHDLILHRRQWPLGKARVINGNATWHHLRFEAVGDHLRVLVDGKLLIDRADGRAAPRGRIALAAYTGGVGECSVWYDNVVVTALDSVATPER
jgi:hypothetical protein